MKKTYFSILILSLLLACLTACGAQAKQPDEPAPAQQVDQTEPTQPEQPAEPAPEQIASQVSVQQDMTFDQLKPYFQKSFEMSEYLDGDMESHIQIELDTIEYLVDVDGAGTLPGNYADMYRNWRPLRLSEHFTDCNETVYATSQVNLRKGPSTDYEKVGSLKGGDSITRTGIGTGDFENWSRVILADGTEVYVNNGYISTTKPVVQQQQTKPSGGGSITTSKSSGTTQSTTPSSGQSSSSDGTIYTWTPEGGGIMDLSGGGYSVANEGDVQYSGTIH